MTTRKSSPLPRRSLPRRQRQQLARLLASLAPPRERRKPPASGLSGALDWLTGHWALVTLGLSALTLILVWIWGASPLHPVLKIIEEQKDWHRKQEKQDLTRIMADRLVIMGQEFLNEGLYPAAQEQFKEVLNLDPTHVGAQLGLLKSEVYKLFQGEYNPAVIDKRLKVIDKIIQEDNRAKKIPADPRTLADPHVLVYKGDLHVILGEYDEALKVYRQAFERAPDLAQAYFKSGWAHEQLGNDDQAVDMYAEAVKKSPLNRDYLNNLAGAYGRTGRSDLALATYQRVNQVDPQFVLPYLEMALNLRAWGHLEAAWENFRVAAALLEDPQATAAGSNRGPWAFKSAAGQVYLHDLKEKQVLVLLNLAATLYLLGQDSEAQHTLTRVRPLQPQTMPSLLAVMDKDLDRVTQPRERLRGFHDLVRRELPVSE